VPLLCGIPMAAAPPLDGQQQLEFIDVVNERLLIPNHREMPIYVPYLKTTLTMGHFILVCKSDGDPLISKFYADQTVQTTRDILLKYVVSSLFFSEETFQHINNPAILPQRMCSTACLNVVEVVNIGKIAEVNIASICGVAFIFLESEVNNQTYCIQGIKNAFVIRSKYCLSSKLLIPLDASIFFSFPDLDPAHQGSWTECYGKSIFVQLTI
jgi:hypothetical protein